MFSFEIGPRSARLIGKEIERVAGIFSKKDAVGLAAGFAQVFSPQIRLVDLSAKDQAAESGAQVSLC